ncbi:MAG: hypothetical protein LBV67_04745, partial [Streptococcaceae bacterium]|nr:hypothetical protein [Streptococcaceae bacterium]
MANKFIGIDAGATKTKAAIYDEQGTLLAQTLTGHGNIMVDEAVACENVTKAIENLLPHLKTEDDNYLLLGMAGVQVAGKEQEMMEYLTQTFPQFTQVQVINDGYLGMIAGLEGKNGVFAVAGTGSVVYAKNEEKIVRIGGFGHLLGDEGGAYAIGKELFQHFCQAIDYDQLGCQLFQNLMAKENITAGNEYDLVRKFYTLSKEEVAQYAVFVSKEAQNGNVLAIHL